MTEENDAEFVARVTSQSAFVRGFIDDQALNDLAAMDSSSQSAFVRGFIDDTT